ncbi:hypothetical protein Tco_0366877 [Tanacetum coccineum]
MASQDARLSKFEADFKRQQGEMTNKINIVLKAITDQIASTLPSDTVKNRSWGLIQSRLLFLAQLKTHNAQTVSMAQSTPSQSTPSSPKDPKLGPQSSNTKFVCFKEDDGEVMFIEIIRDNDEPQNEDPNEGDLGGNTTEGRSVRQLRGPHFQLEMS